MTNKKYTDKLGNNIDEIADIIKNKGFYSDNNVWNSIEKFPSDNHLYRARVETIIVKNNRYVFVKKDSNGGYSLPGGSKEKDIPDIIQATNECREEARINVRDIEATGLYYKVVFDTLHKRQANNEHMIYWNGHYTDIYVAQYDSLYKGKIDSEDQDSYILSGKFYPIKQCLKFFRKEHKEALIWYLKNHVGENEVISEAASIYENNINKFIKNNIKTPNDLSNWMKNKITYENFTKLKTAEDVYKSKKGSCHDQVIFENYVFNKLHIPHGCLFMIESSKNQDGTTHSLLYFIKNKKYYWFENACEKYRGINGPYESLKQLKTDVESKWNLNSKYSDFYITTMKNTKNGMNLQDLVNSCCEEPEEQVMKESTNINQIYYLSDKNYDKKMIVPKIPNNYLTQNNFEDNKTKRVCFYQNIDGAIMSLPSRNNGDELFVHIPISPSCKYYIPSAKEVPDCKITKEVWVDRPIKVQCIGKISLLKDSGKPPHKYTYGKKYAELSEWDWKWKEKYKKEKQTTEQDTFKESSEYIKIDKTHEMESVKFEKALTTKKRNSLDDDTFGIPELRKYPLNDKNHVLSAIRYFNHVDKKYEEELAKNIINAMKKYGIPKTTVGDKNRLQRYL